MEDFENESWYEPVKEDRINKFWIVDAARSVASHSKFKVEDAYNHLRSKYLPKDMSGYLMAVTFFENSLRQEEKKMRAKEITHWNDPPVHKDNEYKGSVNLSDMEPLSDEEKLADQEALHRKSGQSSSYAFFQTDHFRKLARRLLQGDWTRKDVYNRLYKDILTNVESSQLEEFKYSIELFERELQQIKSEEHQNKHKSIKDYLITQVYKTSNKEELEKVLDNFQEVIIHIEMALQTNFINKKSTNNEQS